MGQYQCELVDLANRVTAIYQLIAHSRGYAHKMAGYLTLEEAYIAQEKEIKHTLLLESSKIQSFVSILNFRNKTSNKEPITELDFKLLEDFNNIKFPFRASII